MSGKGSNRRRENREAVEANWPTTWDAREQEAQPQALTTDEAIAFAVEVDARYDAASNG